MSGIGPPNQRVEFRLRVLTRPTLYSEVPRYHLPASQYPFAPLVCDVIELDVDFNLLNNLGDGVIEADGGGRLQTCYKFSSWLRIVHKG